MIQTRIELEDTYFKNLHFFDLKKFQRMTSCTTGIDLHSYLCSRFCRRRRGLLDELSRQLLIGEGEKGGGDEMRSCERTGAALKC